MRLDFSGERVMAVVAHPDDAELLCAGTLARAGDDGAAIAICVMCQGDKGHASNWNVDLKTVRRREMESAAELLKADLFCCDLADGTLADDPDSRRKLIEVFRRFRPTLVLAHAPSDYHADHRAASQLAEAATWFCTSRGHHTASSPLDRPPALWWMDTIVGTDFEPGFFVDVSPFVALKEEMLRCHVSQLQREADQDFGSLADLMQHQQSMRGVQAGVAAAEAFQLNSGFKRGRVW